MMTDDAAGRRIIVLCLPAVARCGGGVCHHARVRTDRTPTDGTAVPPANPGPGMLSVAELDRLAPHLDERRRYLGLPTDQAPTSHTYGKIMRREPTVQKTTLGGVDRRLENGPDGQPDGLWPPGTAWWLASGQISRPGQRPEDHRANDTDTDRGAYILAGQILTRLPGASPDRQARVQEHLRRAWAELDEQQGR